MDKTIVKYITNNKIFYICLLYFFLACYVFPLQTGLSNFYDICVFVITNPKFICLFVVPIITVLNILIFNSIYKNSEIFSRIYDRKELLKRTTTISLKSLCVLFLCFILLLMIGIFTFCDFDYQIHVFSVQNVELGVNVYLLIYSAVRLFIFTIVYTLFINMLLVFFKNIKLVIAIIFTYIITLFLVKSVTLLYFLNPAYNLYIIDQSNLVMQISTSAFFYLILVILFYKTTQAKLSKLDIIGVKND